MKCVDRMTERMSEGRGRHRIRVSLPHSFSSSLLLSVSLSLSLSVPASLRFITTLTLVAILPLPAGHAADIGGLADPFVYLFDTGAAAAKPLPDSAVGARSGWTKLEEDDLTHQFAGDVAMANDKLAVVIRRQGPGAEVYSQTAAGWRRRAVLMPLPMDGRHVAESDDVRIIENQPGAAVLEVSHCTDAGARPRARYRLTTGRGLVEVVPLKGADRLVVWTLPKLLVVPEFLADDMVFGPKSFGRWRMALPTEGLLLQMLAGGDAMLMCVWPEGPRPADALFSEAGAKRRLGGCEIRCVPERALWVALLEGADLWHAHRLPANGSPESATPPWQPTFAATWRVDSLEDGVFARSADAEDGAATAGSLSGPVLIYPIDRSRATPLSRFTPGDVVRDTLGVGPCQYVLAREGLANPAQPTPENVAAYVEQQLRKPKADRDRQQIGRQLPGAVEHVRQAEARIARYAAWAVELEMLLAAVRGADEGGQLGELRRTAARLKRIAAPDPDSTGAAEQCRRLADAILALVDKDDPAADLQKLSAELHELGARQSRALAGCRLTVRWLREQARALGAAEVQARCEGILEQHD